MKISQYLREGHINLGVRGKEKFPLIEELSRMLRGDARVINPEKLGKDVIEREKLESTGIGVGIAIPHARTDAVRDIVVLMARLEKPIDYKSIDGKPVNIMFLIGTPKDAVQAYLKLLASITRLAKNESVRERLVRAATPSEVLEILKQNEEE